MHNNTLSAYELKQLFIHYFGGSDNDIRIFTAPGRVNLIGEHIDYCGGSVFPAALTLSCVAAVRLNGTTRINMRADDLDGLYSIDLDNTSEGRNLKWGNYQAGVIHGLIEAGYSVRGMDMLFTGDIPFGSGLSSSAAIELTTAVAARELSENHDSMSHDNIELALIGQKAEHTFCGVNCGIMDQFASAMGRKDNAILLNCSSLEYRYIPLDLGDYRVVLANTCKKHSLGTSEYNKRRLEVAEGLKRMNKVLSRECRNLCDYTEEDYYAAEGSLTHDKIRDRVKHVILENERVRKAVSALEKGDLVKFGEILREANDSIRYLYEVTGYELDTMYDLACNEDGCIGSRMTGAGFGGCTINIVHKDFAAGFAENMKKSYTKATGIVPEFYTCSIGDGAREITV